ncbi:MAG TPA: hypothetical protein DHW40_02675 [Microbacterium sp.]|nr:hypothetical protein [Microbacterium sp.]
MASGSSDDDAFRWEGDDSPTRPPRAEKSDAALPDGWRAVGKGSEAPADSAPSPSVGDDTSSDTTSLGSAALVTLGLLGGIYLLYTVGWVLGGARTALAISPYLAPGAVVPAQWLAVAAPALWFGGTLLLTRSSAVWVRLAWLVVGVFLLLPWPFVTGV